MEIFLFFMLIAFVLILLVGGFAFAWYGVILLKDQDFFLKFLGIFLIMLSIFFIFAGFGTAAILLTTGLKF